MSSALRSMQKRLSKKLRRGLNTKGEEKGSAQMPRKQHGGEGLQWLTKNHAVRHADKDCRKCHGTGVVQTAYVKDGKAKRLACSCVPVTS
jgi:hypothetical protein